MKIRKLTAALLAGALLASVTGTALAAPGDTVPGAVYGLKNALEKVADQAKDEIRKNLEKLGGLTQAEINQKVEEQVQAKVVEVVDNKLKSVGITDVKATDWSAPSLAILAEAGILKPDTTGKVNPKKESKVGEAVTVFAKVLGITNKVDSEAEAVAAAKEAGLIDPKKDVSQPMTRLETAKLLGKVLGVESVKLTPAEELIMQSEFFGDVKGVSAEERRTLFLLKKLGVFKGFPDGSFKPEAELTVEQIAVLIDRVLGIVGQ